MSEMNRRVVLGGLVTVAAATAVPRVAWGTGDGGLRPVRLTTEHLTDPLGIETTTPRFGWQLEASGTGRAQHAYRIMVATRKELLAKGRPDVWDSGRVVSAEQSALVYKGPPLRPKTRYHWAVQVWDDQPGPVSEPAWFETALRDWAAEWIGSGSTVAKPVQVLPQNRYDTVDLPAGHTLGQSFLSTSRLVGLAVLLEVAGTAGCVMSLLRDNPRGELVREQVLTGLAPDEYGEAQGRLDFPNVLEPGRYYVELSDVRGKLGWKGVLRNVYRDGTAFADRQEVAEDRWVYGIPPSPPANPLLRKEFDISASITSARLHISGLGHAVAWINGRRVGDTELSPSTDYDRRILYTTHDVTSLVRRGKNAIGVALGRGWFATRTPDTDGSNFARWIAEPQLRAQLELTTADGHRTVPTGPDWQLTEGPTVHDGLYSGETYDARQAENGWAEPGFAATGWRPATVVASPGGRMTAYPAEPMRAGKPIRPAEVTQLPDGVKLYDFGVVLSGHVRMSGRMPAGTTVRMSYGEKLAADGRVKVGIPGGNENSSVDGRYQLDEYVAAGQGVETWEPAGTFKSFQFVEVTGPVDVVAVPVASDVASTMDLRVGHPELQWIADAFTRTARNALHGHPEITKLGWTSATYRATQSMLYQFGLAAFFDKWLEDIRLSQAPDGEIPTITPQGATWGGGLVTPSSTGVYPFLVRRYWLIYGDRTVPEKHFDGVRRYLEWLLARLPDGVDDQFGDWYPPGVTGNPQAPEGGELVGTAYAIQSVRDGVAVAELLGRTELARTWRSREEQITRRFNERFLDPVAGEYRTGTPVGYRQTSNAVPLAFGLVPPKLVDAVAAGLAADVEAKDRHLNTGALGTRALPFALTDNGRHDLATAVLTQRTYPSYGHLRAQGATTFWEKWEATARGHQDTTLSSPVEWLVERAAGVEPLAPGWARFRVAPHLPGTRIVLDTVRGRIEVDWRRIGGELVLDLTVPVNTVAEVALPGVYREAGSGRHRIVS